MIALLLALQLAAPPLPKPCRPASTLTGRDSVYLYLPCADVRMLDSATRAQLACTVDRMQTHGGWPVLSTRRTAAMRGNCASTCKGRPQLPGGRVGVRVTNAKTAQQSAHGTGTASTLSTSATAGPMRAFTSRSRCMRTSAGWKRAPIGRASPMRRTYNRACGRRREASGRRLVTWAALWAGARKVPSWVYVATVLAGVVTTHLVTDQWRVDAAYQRGRAAVLDGAHFDSVMVTRIADERRAAVAHTDTVLRVVTRQVRRRFDSRAGYGARALSGRGYARGRVAGVGRRCRFVDAHARRRASGDGATRQHIAAIGTGRAVGDGATGSGSRCAAEAPHAIACLGLRARGWWCGVRGGCAMSYSGSHGSRFVHAATTPMMTTPTRQTPTAIPTISPTSTSTQGFRTLSRHPLTVTIQSVGYW